MATVMLLAMLVMMLAAWCYSVAVVLHRARSIILMREAHTAVGAAAVEVNPGANLPACMPALACVMNSFVPALTPAVG